MTYKHFWIFANGSGQPENEAVVPEVTVYNGFQ
jgi:hypothetical protein